MQFLSMEQYRAGFTFIILGLCGLRSTIGVEQDLGISHPASMRRVRALKVGLLVLTLMIGSSLRTFAGMPSFALRDVYRLRIQEISFFLALLLGCALVFKLVWNYGFKEFQAIPRLSYLRALSLSVLFGLLMLLVLTMISGIREVLTPGAWRKQGSTYRLNNPSMEPVRQRSLEHLRSALFDYARLHNGIFPKNDYVSEIPEKLWETPDQEGSRYVYSGGYTTNDAQALLVVEPGNFGAKRFALKGSGEIVLLTDDPAR